MRKPLRILGLHLVALAAGIGAAVGEDYGRALGSVRFATSCDAAAAPLLDRGLALLHHMTYEGARAAFEAAAEADPECALALWGQAMTFVHPLWSDPPGEESFARGAALLAEAERRGLPSDRERGYLAAARGYYAPGRQPTETANLAGFEAGWRQAHATHPDDPEAALFFALAHLATADPADKTYAHQQRAGAIAEEVLSRIPDHPGAHHYAIHAYDYPPLAARALEIARSYGRIAPAVPHALHMPTHIFTRLGLWEESIAGNRSSAAAALEHPAGEHLSLHYLHALDYLAYAHLQRGERAAAEQVQATLAALQGPFQAEVAVPYTFAAVPARLALERGEWAAAARLAPRQPAAYPWDRFPAIEAITHFARGLGAARSGDLDAARRAAATLEVLRDLAAESSAYWAQQVEIQRLSTLAWSDFAGGRREAGLATMRRAVELEASTEKHPVTPGEVLPARELLADMLLAMGRHAEALAEYEAVLERSPRRFNALYGAGRSAQLAGRSDAAAEHYADLLELADQADAGIEELESARAYLAGTTSAMR